MEALLPSEIARLVLGYLQEQKCEEAARIFMETSPVLQECRVVSQRGGRYSTKVGGLSLVDILDKYCTANMMVQEKLSRVSESEQIKQCNDLIEQLRFLLEGSSRGHRFVVNISVPQNSPVGSFGSPIVSGSNRKRHHSHSDKGKRAAKSLNNLMDKSLHQTTANQNCDTVEATPLESLPGYKSAGHTPSSQNYLESNTNVSEKFFNKTNFISSSNEQACHTYTTNNPSQPYSAEPNLIIPNVINSNCKDQSTETVEKHNFEPIKDKCTAGTSTEELMSYTSAEVQTGPCDLLDTEADVNHDESIQNLGILTKELLNRTEIHERIAENINKAILPVETSFREDNTCQNPVEANTSLLTDLDNAIKSVVQATETDPVFEGFLHEIFSVAETDTSPDEDSDGRQMQGLNGQPSPNTIEPMEVDANFGTNVPMQPKIIDDSKGSEIPLKQRLRNSSKSQHINNEDEEKESNTLLESANAEAVMNIVNVIANRRNSLLNNEQTTEMNPVEDPSIKLGAAVSVCSTGTEIEKPHEEVKSKPTKKTNRKSKPKQKPAVSRPEPKPEPEVATMPTLILCSERDVGFFPEKVQVSNTNSHGYLPIVPKYEDPTVSAASEPPPTIYLRTVNVPRHLVNQSTIEATQKVNPLLQKAFQMQQQSPQKQPVPNDEPIVIPVVVADSKLPVTSSPVVRPNSVSTTAPISSGESITLYAGETESTELKMSPISSLPVINLDESFLGMAAGTGLSPFFKANFANPTTEVAKESPKPKELPQPAAVLTVSESPKHDVEVRTKADPPELIPIESNTTEKVEERQEENKDLNRSKSADGIITRRTPKTLLKARSKNNRLSLSTPRRRNSHVRALDFNTPVKFTGTARKQPQSCVRTKSVCRAGLFKSPPFESEAAAMAAAAMNVHSVLDVQTVKKVRTVSPIKPTYLRVPIATRSPAPKLQGNWAKVTGIGLILEGETSTSESSPEKYQTEEKSASTTTTTTTTVTTTIVEKKSWDSDLRKIIGTTVSEEEEKSKPKGVKKSTTKRRNVAEKAKASETEESTNEKKKAANESDAGVKESTADLNTSVEVSMAPNKKNEITPPATTAISKRLVSVKQSTEGEEKQAKPVSAKKASPAPRMPDLLDLETPRKDEPTICIPPTPRVLNTPGDSLIRTVRSKCRNTSIKDCVVDTPDFPVTPCIVHTPKIVDEESEERKPSPYYEPEEQSQSQKPKELVNAEKIVVQETRTTVTIQRSVVELQESKQIEIAQYVEVPHDSSAETDEKDAEVGIMSEDTSKETIEEGEIADESAAANSDSDSDGNESDSSNTSSSSSNTSSSSSSSSSSAKSSPAKSVRECRSKDNSTADSSSVKSVQECHGNNTTVESEYESPETSTVVETAPVETQESSPQTAPPETQESSPQTAPVETKESSPQTAPVETKESSPQKMFSVIEEGEVNETPAKEDNGVVEAEISETPSVSNAERAQRRDSLTNFSSKISAIITTSQSDQARKRVCEETCTVSSSGKDQTTAAAKPKIIKVENIVPTDGIAIQVSKLLQGELHRGAIPTIQQQQQQQQMVNAKLGLTLEEKRLRVMAKFKEDASSKSYNTQKKSNDDAKQKKVPAMRKSVEADKVVSSTTDTSKSKAKPVATEVEAIETEKVEEAPEVEAPKVEEKITEDEKKSEEETKETKKSKGKTSPRKKVVQEKELDRKTEANVVNKVEETARSAIPAAAESSKGISKAKVDQVKRDLFSDEETNDQRTTRSQTARQSVDTQKSDESQNSLTQESSPEKIPGVLECLQLIPANKGDKEHDHSNKSISEEGYSTLQTNCQDTSFVYDESVPIKKRKRKYSSSEIESEYHFIVDDAPGLDPFVETIRLMPFEELFKLSPKIKKKMQSPKKSPSKLKRNKSSPTKSSRCKKTHSEEKKKSCKRKNTSPSKGGKQVEKKPKTDPQTLFNRIKVDEFLKSVHVPE